MVGRWRRVKDNAPYQGDDAMGMTRPTTTALCKVRWLLLSGDRPNLAADADDAAVDAVAASRIEFDLMDGG